MKAFSSLWRDRFYAVLFGVVLSQLGFDPMAIFVSFNSIMLAFAFMTRNAASKYFEGLLYILLQRPCK